MDSRKSLLTAMISKKVHNILCENLGTYYWLEPSPTLKFYIDRLKQVPMYGLKGESILAMICRCAFNDSQLTDSESINIINVCHDERWHNILMEVNLNEGWN